MRLDRLVTVLRTIAPEELAEEWDRVGLQVGSPRQQVRRALLCIDLTERVLGEAIERRCQLVVAYHPPIFQPVVQLTDGTWKERVLVQAVRRRLAVYTPHTALDNVVGGLTDWLIDAVGDGETQAITPRPGASDPLDGTGRVRLLTRPITSATLVRRVKSHLGMKRLKVSTGDRTARIETVAACPGAGGSVLEQASSADAFLTGEMQHHQVLDLTQRGKTVILAGHANSERPFLPVLARRLRKSDGGAVEWVVSTADRSPVEIH